MIYVSCVTLVITFKCVKCELFSVGKVLTLYQLKYVITGDIQLIKCYT